MIIILLFIAQGYSMSQIGKKKKKKKKRKRKRKKEKKRNEMHSVFLGLGGKHNRE
jgi:hypothetical protein